jgi:serine/threonine protein kinase
MSCFRRRSHIMCDRRRLLKEVIAHAAISVQPHIVRYFSAWEENDHMCIQNEYCEGKSARSTTNAM